MAGEWVYSAELVRAIDGDTVVMRVSRPVDFGFRQQHELSGVYTFRLSGIDTPERTGPTRDMGESARMMLLRLLSLGPNTVHSLGEPDKYGGRWDARILVGEVDVGAKLVELGYALPYDGKGPRPTWDPAAPYPLQVAA